MSKIIFLKFKRKIIIAKKKKYFDITKKFKKLIDFVNLKIIQVKFSKNWICKFYNKLIKKKYLKLKQQF